MIIPVHEFLIYTVLLLCFLLATRIFVFRNLSTIHPEIESTEKDELTIIDDGQLRPAEIAFLVRKGDTTHALIVMAFDLMQRTVKNRSDTNFLDKLTNYEKNMWEITSNAVKNWAKKTAKEKLIGESMNPVHIAKRLSFVYKFVTNSLKVMVSDLITDPKKIRQYFSYKGLWRIIADFSSAGYKQAFEQEIRTTLLTNGFIVDQKSKGNHAGLLLVASVLGIIGTLIISLISFSAWYIATTIWFTAIVSAAALRIILILRQLLPLYEELAVVADQIERKSKRLTFLKFLIRSVDAINWTAALFVVLLLSSIGLIFAKLCFFELGFTEIYFYISILTANFVSVDLLFQSIDLNIRDYPTQKAQDELTELKVNLKDQKPLDSFKVLLESEEYNPELSKLMAVYGIETLFILA